MPAPRSPSYPSIPLPEAINKAKQIYEKEHMSMMTPPVAAEAMGYTSLNGASLRTIGALKKWGLLEGRGENLRLTKDAQTLSIDDENSPDYRDAVARSATAPEVFLEISKQFPGLASERNISVYLEKQGYTRDASAALARFYKESIALVEGGQAPYSDGNSPPDPAHMTMTAESSRRTPPRFYGGGIVEPVPVPAPTRYESGPVGNAEAPYRITMNGTKLRIEADVDLAGLQKLKQMLDGYENILKLLDVPVSEIKRPEWAGKSFSEGEPAPTSAHYNAHHFGHLGSPSENQVYIKEGHKFPPCPNCGMGAVRYEFLG